MSKQEYRKEIHKILDLVMDIQEQDNCKIGLQIGAASQTVAVYTFDASTRTSAMNITKYPQSDEMDSTTEIIEALEKIKAEQESNHE